MPQDAGADIPGLSYHMPGIYLVVNSDGSVSHVQSEENSSSLFARYTRDRRRKAGCYCIILGRRFRRRAKKVVPWCLVLQATTTSSGLLFNADRVDYRVALRVGVLSPAFNRQFYIRNDNNTIVLARTRSVLGVPG